jgi:hypothetical protein
MDRNSLQVPFGNGNGSRNKNDEIVTQMSKSINTTNQYLNNLNQNENSEVDLLNTSSYQKMEEDQLNSSNHASRKSVSSKKKSMTRKKNLENISKGTFSSNQKDLGPYFKQIKSEQ